MPKDWAFGVAAMDFNEHSTLLDCEAGRVDAALFSMATAEGEEEVNAIFNTLTKDTVIALCSRWTRHHKEWMRLSQSSVAPLWAPPDGRGLWRVIYLAMTDDKEAASSVLSRLFPEAPGVLNA
jgi:hypothetical protein